MKTVVFIVGETVLEYGNKLGSSKDFNNRVKVIKEAGYKTLICSIKGRSDLLARKRLKQLLNQKEEIYSIIFEHTRWPKSIKYASILFSDSIILVRSHNAEIYHAYDMLEAYVKTMPLYRYYLKDLSNIIVKIFISIYQELVAARYADRILTCNEKELDYYRGLMFYSTKKNKIRVVNTVYKVEPEKYVRAETTKNLKVVFIGSYLPTYYNDHALKIIIKECATKKDENVKDMYQLNITGNYGMFEYHELSRHINYLGVVDNVNQVLGEADIVLFPSKYGRGIKTRIFDAVSLNKNVIVHQDLYDRLPDCLQRGVNSWDPKISSLESLILSFDNHAVNHGKGIDLDKYVADSNRELLKSLEWKQ